MIGTPTRTMRLLTHNTLRNNSAEAKGKGFPLRITATEIRVDDGFDVGEDIDKQVTFVKSILGILDWVALVKVSRLLCPIIVPREMFVLF